MALNVQVIIQKSKIKLYFCSPLNMGAAGFIWETVVYAILSWWFVYYAWDLLRHPLVNINSSVLL